MKKTKEMLGSKYVRLIAMVVVAINSIAVMFGYDIVPFSDDQITMGISAAALVISETWNHYKNNSYSLEAKKADAYMNRLKGDK